MLAVDLDPEVTVVEVRMDNAKGEESHELINLLQIVDEVTEAVVVVDLVVVPTRVKRRNGNQLPNLVVLLRPER